jgi:potassium-transporting ATPase KdpC subunit
MRRPITTALLYTIVTTVLFGILYPYAVTCVAQLFFPNKANGQLIRRGSVIVGSTIIGQPFSGPAYFHSRPSAAGNGYDAANSSGSNLGPTNKKLLNRIASSVTSEQPANPNTPVPIDLVTSSGSGLDPDITPAAAEFQIPRVAQERHFDEGRLRKLVSKHTLGRQFGFLGEPRVNVLELNLDLDQSAKPTR